MWRLTQGKRKTTKEMGVFSTKETGAVAQNSMNQLGVGTLLAGDLKSESDIRIDGTIRGSVTTSAKLVVGATGVVEGDGVCQNAYIEGHVSGKMEVSGLLILNKSAHIEGDITIAKLVVEEGATFNGRCAMNTSSVVSMENEQKVRAIH